MAKLNRTQTVELARKAAGDYIKEFTLDELAAMDWEAQRTAARTTASNNYVASGRTDIDAKYVEVYVNTLADTIVSGWGHRVQARENARRQWKKLISNPRVEQAAKDVRALIESMAIRGARITDNYGGVRVEVGRNDGWNSVADLTIRFDRMRRDTFASETNPDDPAQRAGVYDLEIQTSWGGTSRSLAQSAMAIKVYQQLVDVGLEVQALWERQTVVWVYPEPEPVQPTVVTPEQVQAAAEEAGLTVAAGEGKSA